MSDIDKEFKRLTKTKYHKEGGVSIDCKYGLWGVTTPSKEEAEREAKHYFIQYYLDGDYDYLENSDIKQQRGEMMGDYYDFVTKIIDGEAVKGFYYSNEDTGRNEIFVQMTDEQLEFANKWQKEYKDLENKKIFEIIKWIS